MDNRAECRGLVRQLLENGWCDLTMCPKEKIGLFMAGSDAGKQLRLTVDGRRSNVHFKSPSSSTVAATFGSLVGKLANLDGLIQFGLRLFFPNEFVLKNPYQFSFEN